MELRDLVDPHRTALVTQECQVGVIGPDAALAELAGEARREAVPALGRLVPAARSAGAAVVHCVVAHRADGRGGNTNARLFSGAAALGVDLTEGGPGVALLPELGADPGDIVLTRMHGIGPMSGTQLDPVLRNLGVDTIVATGVSVNVAITNLVMDAVNLGYRVVVPRDAVAGVPSDYAEAVIGGTLSVLATITTADELVRAWADTTREDTR